MIFIRQSTHDDLDTVCDLAVLAWQGIFDCYREQMGDEMFEVFYGEWKKNKYNEVRNSFTNNPSRAYVVIDDHDDNNAADESVIGFFSYYVDGNRGTVASNAIHPSYRGRGISTRMYNYIFECMKREGVEYAKVLTGGDYGHFAARKAYEKAGFDHSVPSVTYYRKL